MAKMATAIDSALILVAALSVVGYVRSQSELREVWKTLDREMTRVRTIETINEVRDRLEGLPIDSAWLAGLKSTQGVAVSPDSVLSQNRCQWTLLLLYSMQGCMACVDQEIAAIDSNSILAQSPAKLRIVMLSPDSLFDVARFKAVRRVKHRIYQDSIDLLRSSLGIRRFTPVEMLIQGNMIHYITCPRSGDIYETHQFLAKVGRTITHG